MNDSLSVRAALFSLSAECGRPGLQSLCTSSKYNCRDVEFEGRRTISNIIIDRCVVLQVICSWRVFLRHQSTICMNHKSNIRRVNSNLGSWFKLWCKIIPPTHAQAKLVLIESEALGGGETVNKSCIITACQTSQIGSVPFLPLRGFAEDASSCRLSYQPSPTHAARCWRTRRWSYCPSSSSPGCPPFDCSRHHGYHVDISYDRAQIHAE